MACCSAKAVALDLGLSWRFTGSPKPANSSPTRSLAILCAAMRHFKNEDDDEDHYSLGRVVFLSDRIYAPSHRKAGCHQPFDFFKIGRNNPAAVRLAMNASSRGPAVRLRRRGSLPGAFDEVMCHVQFALGSEVQGVKFRE